MKEPVAIRQTFETYSHPVRVGLQRSAVLRAHNLGKLPNRVIKDLQQIGKGQLSNAAGSVNRPISLKNSKNCRSKRLAIAWMKRIAEPGSKRKNVGTSESELGVSSTEGQADRPSRLAAG